MNYKRIMGTLPIKITDRREIERILRQLCWWNYLKKRII